VNDIPIVAKHAGKLSGDLCPTRDTPWGGRTMGLGSSHWRPLSIRWVRRHHQL